MATTEPLTGTRIPGANDAPNLSQYYSNQAYDLAINTIPRFATVSARDSAYAAYTAAGGTLVNGRTCYTFDAGYFERVNGAWQSMHGLIGHGIAGTGGGVTLATSASTTVVEFGTAIRFSCYLQTGRAYEYSGELRAWSTVSGDIAGMSGRLAIGTPLPTSPGIGGFTASLESATVVHVYQMLPRRVFQVAASGTYTVGMFGNRVAGTGTVTFQHTSEGTATHQIKDVGVALSTVPFPA